MSILYSHLEQINTSARSIGDLHFPPPKVFTNALLYNQEITSLIRDTEPHERALFSVDPSVSNETGSGSKKSGTEGVGRRKTINPIPQRQSSAVARVLGNEMLKKIQRSNRESGRSRGVDVEMLLVGAERLCSVYAVSGTSERIAALRNRYGQIAASIEHYEDKVGKLQARLNRANQPSGYDDYSDPEEQESAAALPTTIQRFTEDDLKSEEAAVKELESKKKALEERVAEMEKDLGGLR